MREKRFRLKYGVDLEGEKISFDEYYGLFVSTKRNANPWNLVKYYLLKPDIGYFGDEKSDGQQDQEHKKAIIDIGTKIFDGYIERREKEQFKKEAFHTIIVQFKLQFVPCTMHDTCTFHTITVRFKLDTGTPQGGPPYHFPHYHSWI